MAAKKQSKSVQKRVETQKAPRRAKILDEIQQEHAVENNPILKQKEDAAKYTEERFVATLTDQGQIFMALCWWGVTKEGKRHCFNFIGSVKEGPVIYAVCPIKDGERATPTDSHTPAQFTEYLKGRLLKWGGSDDVYAILGVEKPAVPPVPEPQPVQSNVANGSTSKSGDSNGTPKPPKPKRPKSDAPAIPLDSMYQQAAKALGEKEADLRKKYAHLNPGLQGMNLRNRMRAKGVEPKA